jgi:D-alanyl-D-alanine carboxypeptidase/D-alanyl-D-alanine-endopeptidase (penicillin-binding protein 4)
MVRFAWRMGLGAIAAITLARVATAAPVLQELAGHVGAGQGVFVEAEDGTVLVSQAAERAVHPASVTKVATSLALLKRLGVDHRFETRLVATGPVRDGVVHGNLRVEAGRDPFLVSEGAFLMLQRLRAQGVEAVEGRLLVHGPFLFNWQPDPDGKRFARTLEGEDGTDAWAAMAASAPGTPRLRDVALRFENRKVDRKVDASGAERTLVVHRSPPLVHVIKSLNEYSNNVFHLVSEVIGGPQTVESVARESVAPALRDEIVIENGAGAGTTNRLSPRAAVALLRALSREVERQGYTLTDVLPVSAVDPGTLVDRLTEPASYRRTIVGKTGTFGSVGASALAGVLRTRRYGRVAFAVLNHNVPVPAARGRQDAFVRALVDATAAEPWPYDQPVRPAFTTAQVE